MRISTLIAAALVGLASAQSSPDLPPCVQKCVPSGLGGCEDFDFKCVCSDQKLLAQISCCVSTCAPSEQDAAIKLANSLCKAYGVTKLPTAATCSSGSSPTESSSSGSNASSSPTPTQNSAGDTTNTPDAAAANAGSGLGAGIVAAGVLALL